MSDKIPDISRPRASGQEVVRLGGKDFYLGPWRTTTAKDGYGRVIAEWLVSG